MGLRGNIEVIFRVFRVLEIDFFRFLSESMVHSLFCGLHYWICPVLDVIYQIKN